MTLRFRRSLHTPVLTLTLLVTTACSSGSSKGTSDTGQHANPNPDTGNSGPPETMHVPYGPGEDQWLNLYLADSDTPTPIYLFSHANGGTADSVGGFVAELNDVGITTISWESVVLPDGGQEDIQTGWSDAELMLDWVREHAEIYNLDATRIIAGGRSRGSVFTWRLAHSGDPAIQGIYMFQALPDGVWQGEEWTPVAEVNADSPPMKLTYKEPRYTDDGHDPDNGYAILDRYTELGIGDRAELAEDLGSEPGLYADIGVWCQELLAGIGE